MIKSFTIQDYKSYDSNGVTFEFLNQDNNIYRPVSFFYGTNGSGKSTIKEYLLKHPGLTEGEKMLKFDEEFVKERFANYYGMLAVTTGESDEQEKQLVENKIQDYESFKDTLQIYSTDNPIDVPKVIRGRELVFSGEYNDKIQTSSFHDFFSYEEGLFKNLDKKTLTTDEINNYKTYIAEFKTAISDFDLIEIKKQFLIRLCDYNVNICNKNPEFLTCCYPCFCLYFALKEPLQETRERNLLPKNAKSNNEFFDVIDENKINVFFNTFTDKIKSAVDDKIANLTKLKNVKDPIYVAQKINTFLSSYGFFDIQLEVAKDHDRTIFRILRTFSNDTKKNFETLSEGEKHLLAFLYFYETCLGFDNFDEALNPPNKIILIDDPITSMDDNSIYLVSMLICNLFAFERDAHNNYVSDSDGIYKLKDQYIKQGLIFTHNAYFLRELLLRIKFKKDYMTLHHIFKIVKNGKYVSQQKYVPSFKNEYSLLWDTYFSLKNDRSEKTTFLLPNVCRRILESYGKFEGLDESDSVSKIVDELCKELPDSLSNDEIIIYKSMINCLNNGSHYISATDDLYMQFRHINFATIFEKFFLKLDERHYRIKERQFNSPS